MTRIARKSDGRRIFTDAYKRQQIDRVLGGELTIAELSRSLGIARSLLQRWKRFLPQEGRVAKSVRWPVPSAGESAPAHLRECQLLIGKQAMELDRLRAELGTLERARRPRAAKTLAKQPKAGRHA
jgi:transposase-like protein